MGMGNVHEVVNTSHTKLPRPIYGRFVPILPGRRCQFHIHKTNTPTIGLVDSSLEAFKRSSGLTSMCSLSYDVAAGSVSIFTLRSWSSVAATFPCLLVGSIRHCQHEQLQQSCLSVFGELEPFQNVRGQESKRSSYLEPEPVSQLFKNLEVEENAL